MAIGITVGNLDNSSQCFTMYCCFNVFAGKMKHNVAYLQGIHFASRKSIPEHCSRFHFSVPTGCRERWKIAQPRLILLLQGSSICTILAQTKAFARTCKALPCTLPIAACLLSPRGQKGLGEQWGIQQTVRLSPPLTAKMLPRSAGKAKKIIIKKNNHRARLLCKQVPKRSPKAKWELSQKPWLAAWLPSLSAAEKSLTALFWGLPAPSSLLLSLKEVLMVISAQLLHVRPVKALKWKISQFNLQQIHGQLLRSLQKYVPGWGGEGPRSLFLLSVMPECRCYPVRASQHLHTCRGKQTGRVSKGTSPPWDCSQDCEWQCTQFYG